MCNEAIEKDLYKLAFNPDHYVTQKMCNDAKEEEFQFFKFVSDCYVTQEMCNQVAHGNPYSL